MDVRGHKHASVSTKDKDAQGLAWTKFVTDALTMDTQIDMNSRRPWTETESPRASVGVRACP